MHFQNVPDLMPALVQNYKDALATGLFSNEEIVISVRTVDDLVVSLPNQSNYNRHNDRGVT
ncbi:hypothetical protein FACS1894172_21110 [Spirochaetia bacterium]|nr:hypothetical protein FACS1894172_21110 [Spirochaetia bacterium]